MPSYKNFKILFKVLLLLALLAGVSLGTTVFSTGKMRYIDDTYGNLIDGPGRANLAIARANRNLVYVERSIYRLITEITEDGNTQAMKEVTDTKGYFDNQIATAVKHMPAEEADIKNVAGKFDTAFTGGCGDTVKLANSVAEDDKKKAATSMREKCDPALRTAMEDISALTNQILKINDKDSEDALAVTNATIRNTYLLVFGGVAVITLLAIVLTRSTISQPIRKICDVLKELARGNLDIEIQGAERKDEVGDIARAALIFRDQGRDTQQLRQQQERDKAKAEEERKAMLLKLANDFETNVQEIINTTAAASTQLYQTAKAMQNNVAGVNEQSGIASKASQQTSLNVQNVSASVEEMSSSIKEIASQIAKSGTLVKETVARASQADKTTHMLSEAVSEIGGVLELIKNIAGQINLLALNATIESARAGEAGKGFAVVASEVKNLAGQTTKATEEITRQIVNVQQSSKEVVEVLKTIQNDIGNVNQYSSGVASAVEEQSAVTNEISANMQQASQNVNNITGNISDITKSSSEADRAAGDVLKAAQELSKLSELLNRRVASFLTGIRNG